MQIKLQVKWTLMEQYGCGFDSSGSGNGPVVGPCEHGNELSGSRKLLGVSYTAGRQLASHLLHAVSQDKFQLRPS
jgi:hypothetical protein